LLRAPPIRFSKPMFRRFSCCVFILSSPEIQITLITFNYQLLRLRSTTIIHTRAQIHYLRVTYYNITLLLCAALEYLHNINNIILSIRGVYVVPRVCVFYVNIIYAVRNCKKRVWNKLIRLTNVNGDDNDDTRRWE